MSESHRSWSLHFFSKDSFEGVRHELVACALVELVLELNPVKSESVQEALESIHAHQHSECESEEPEEQCPEL